MSLRRLLGDKRVVVTGGASGIGRAVALAAAGAGAAVAVLDVDEGGAEATAREIAALGGTVRAVAVDIGDETQVDQAFAECEQHLGPLSGVVCNAGVELIGVDSPIDQLETFVWAQTIRTNLTGTFFCLRSAIRRLLANDSGGSIVVTGSPTGLFGVAAGSHAYSASKGGVHALARVAAVDYARAGIRVNVVVPGFIDTEMNRPLMDDPVLLRQELRKIPMARTATPQEVTGLYLYLLGDESSYATGGLFFVDGGMTAT